MLHELFELAQITCLLTLLRKAQIDVTVTPALAAVIITPGILANQKKKIEVVSQSSHSYV